MQKRNQEILFSASDLTYFAECKHRTWLDRCYLDSPMERADETESMKLVMKKGLEHEAAHLQTLKDQGLNVVEITTKELDEQVRQTTQAIESGADVVFQATLRRGAYIGHADFLVRTPHKSPSGQWVYDVVDTKLSHHTKTKFLVQLCFYSDLLADITGQLPEHIHVELGNGQRDTYRVNDYFAYYSKLMADFEASLGLHTPQPVTYPDPCNFCSLCHWRERCDQQRLEDDHLSQVANITKTQIVKLASIGVTTMKGLSQLGENAKVKGIVEAASELPTGKQPGSACKQVGHIFRSKCCIFKNIFFLEVADAKALGFLVVGRKNFHAVEAVLHAFQNLRSFFNQVVDGLVAVGADGYFLAASNQFRNHVAAGVGFSGARRALNKQANDFKPARAATKKKSSWLMPKSGEVFYVNRASSDGVSMFIFHPDKSKQAADAVQKAGLKFGPDYFHSSNMTLFPKRQNKGVNLIPYGWPVDAKRLDQIKNLILDLK